MGISECGERVVIIASFENVSRENNTFCELNANDETCENFSDEASELSVQRTHLDGKS